MVRNPREVEVERSMAERQRVARRTERADADRAVNKRWNRDMVMGESVEREAVGRWWGGVGEIICEGPQN